MDKEKLLRFHLEQMDVVKKNRDKIRKQGYVKGYQDVYPDIFEYLGKKKGTAYIRGSVSVKLMALLYDKLVLFIPPLPKDQIEKRFFLTWEELVTLCQHSIVIPIIGDAQNYTEPYFEELFTNLPAKPASLWARGLSLLDVLDMDDALNEARQILPMEALSQDEGLLAKAAQDYKTRDLPFLREIIRDDVAVMYADLCIFWMSAGGNLPAFPESERDLSDTQALK